MLQGRLATGLADALRDGYRRADFGRDVLAGMVVAVIALPLSMALAIASGVPPQHGLYTAIVAGAVVAICGGSRFQVTGPTAAFVVILAPISAQFGIGGLCVATLIAGAILVAMGLARLGRAIEFIPAPVTTGFTAGIAVVIATLQVKDFLGLDIAKAPETYIEKLAQLWVELPTARSQEIFIGLLTLAVLVIFPKITRRVPSPLVALSIAGVTAYALAHLRTDFHVVTINDRFSYGAGDVVGHGIPRTPPMPLLPWNLAGPNGLPIDWSFDLLKRLTMAGFSIAMLGAIESLLSAVVADGMGGTRHDPDGELLGQGLGNLAAPFFGGIAATGALARTAANIRAGARSPLASAFHALFVLAAVVLLAPVLGYLPMASLAALLLMVAWNMSEKRHFVHVLRTAPRWDVFVLLVCFLLTVFFDMVIAVGVGVVLASLIFIARIAAASDARVITGHHQAARRKLPPGVIVYEVGGPLLFGAAQRATRALSSIGADVKVLVLDVSDVPALDATGLVELEAAINRLARHKTFVIVAGARRGVLEVLVKAGWRGRRDHLAVVGDVARAIEKAEERVGAAAP